MPHLLDLPLELLIVIFEFILRSQDIAVLCLVNRTFNQFATPVLYRWIYIFPWHKDSKSKVASLFTTLAECPRLAVSVQKLEIRDFPKGTSSPCRIALLDLCVKGIRNCINLRSCTWTRDGSLHSEILDSLRDCPELRELEINGNSSQYDPNVLTRFKKLSRISLIMPSAQVLDILPTWISVTHATLRTLTIICKASPLVTDAFLESLSLNLDELEHLLIVGCPRASHRGIGALVSRNRNGLLTLGLEGLSQSFDMDAFQALCNRTGALRRLRFLTFTIPTQNLTSDWTHSVEELLRLAPLEFFQLNSTESLGYTPMLTDLLKSVIITHGPRLKRFSLHRVQISLPVLYMICSRCPLLEQLFVAIAQQDLEAAAPMFFFARNLRALHISLPPTTSESSILPFTMLQIALSVVSHCSSTLTHIGCNTRAWQVQRVVHVDGNGEKYTQPALMPPETPEIPEQFLVARG